MTAFLVDAADVEHGDLIAGHPVAAILLDCADGRTWEYRDPAGSVIALAPVGGQVEVVRSLSGEAGYLPALRLPDGAGRGSPFHQEPPTGLNVASSSNGVEGVYARQSGSSILPHGLDAPSGVDGHYAAPSPTGYIEPDPCNPRGITRRHGLYMVVP